MKVIQSYLESSRRVCPMEYDCASGKCWPLLQESDINSIKPLVAQLFKRQEVSCGHAKTMTTYEMALKIWSWNAF